MSTDGEKYMLYHYEPSTAAAVVFVVLFALTAILHVYQLVSKRTWYFIPFIVGGLFEAIGYIGRLLSSREDYGDWTTPPYVMQSLLILLAPAFFAASIYMVLGRIIVLTDGEQYSIIPARWLTKLLIFFGLFIVTAGIYHYRIVRGGGGAAAAGVPWQQYLFILYVASTFIMIRSLFRIIEYAQGSDGYLLSTEVFIYVFDATLMFLTMVIFNVRHPSAIIHGKTKHIEVAMQDRSHSEAKYTGQQAV
ncbi:hypothetical protein DID88_008642 [Monilinia fructigena]|uniref:RTA1 domain protein n=1 Tax=Monilinia fructigena TaxID=38457 RepID=A0A395J5Z5_9HELO|nr:hypothetical protein DID88_008642 [Monilinia fructigena]